MPKALYDTSLYFGSYPELVDKKYRLFDDWYASYIEKDFRSIANVGDLRDFQMFTEKNTTNSITIGQVMELKSI